MAISEHTHTITVSWSSVGFHVDGGSRIRLYSTSTYRVVYLTGYKLLIPTGKISLSLGTCASRISVTDDNLCALVDRGIGGTAVVDACLFWVSLEFICEAQGVPYSSFSIAALLCM